MLLNLSTAKIAKVRVKLTGSTVFYTTQYCSMELLVETLCISYNAMDPWRIPKYHLSLIAVVKNWDTME